MPIFSLLGIKAKLGIALAIAALAIFILVFLMFAAFFVIRGKSAVGGCKKIPYGPVAEGKCGSGYYVVAILDREGILRNPDNAPTDGFMICCRVEE